MANITLAQAIERFTGEVERCQEIQDAWAEAFKVNAARTLGRDSTIFDTAARQKVFGQYLRFLTGEVSPNFEGDRVQAVIDDATKQVLYMAEDNPASTSAVNNLMENATRVATVKMIRRLQGHFI